MHGNYCNTELISLHRSQYSSTLIAELRVFQQIVNSRQSFKVPTKLLIAVKNLLTEIGL